MAFELANRAFFATAVPDRGDAYLEHLAEHLNELVADQAAGIGAFYLLVDDDASVVGRFNLELGPAGVAELGFRVAQHMCGRGVATATVQELCQLAATRHNVRTVRAAAADTNTASRRVLIKAGFIAVGPARPEELGGKPGTWYALDLTGDSRPDEQPAVWGHAAVLADDSSELRTDH